MSDGTKYDNTFMHENKEFYLKLNLDKVKDYYVDDDSSIFYEITGYDF